jgi:hypothetical protein
MRILRSYERVAQVTHFCDRCCDAIWPDESYEGRVEIWEGGKFFVTKEHIDPVCDWPPDPEDDEDAEFYQSKDDEQQPVEERLPLAA